MMLATMARICHPRQESGAGSKERGAEVAVFSCRLLLNSQCESRSISNNGL